MKRNLEVLVNQDVKMQKRGNTLRKKSTMALNVKKEKRKTAIS